MAERPSFSEANPNPACIEFKEQCQGCTAECGVFKLVVGSIALEAANAELQTTNQMLETKVNSLETEIEELSAKVDRLMYDDIVSTFYSRQGLTEYIISNEAFEAELKDGTCGLLFLDVRFLKFINDTFGMAEGDDFLEATGARIDEVIAERVRTAVKKVEVDLRSAGSPAADIRARYGGDEFVLIIRNVSPRQLQEVAERVQAEFSVQKALNEAHRDEVGAPLVASLAHVHASHLDADMRQNAGGTNILRTLIKNLKTQQDAAKREQYDEMWAAILERGNGGIGRPSDNRGVATEFILMCYPLYYRYMAEKDEHGSLNPTD